MPSPQIERKLAAIMFTDIAGYTGLSAKDSTKASELLTTQRDTLKPIVEKHGGSWMKEIGDGLLLIFDSATAAVECSIAIQEATRDIEDLNLRIGIHQGEVIKQDGDVIGDDVNVTSRIEPFSAIGGVAISDKIYRDISSNQDFETKYIGKPKLKGVSQKVEVYCIISHGLPQTEISKVSAKLEEESKFNIFALTGGILTAIGIAFWIAVGVFDVSFGGKKEVASIAIIPFDNKGADEDEFYAYSISSDVISQLINTSEIRVAGIKDIEKLEYKNLNYTELAEKLFVRYIGQGTLWKKDSIFQLSIEIFDIQTSKVLWSENWTNKWDELTSITSNISDNVLRALNLSNKNLINTLASTSTEAYEYYLKSKYKFEKRSNMEDIQISKGLLEKALQIDNALLIAKSFLGEIYYSTDEYDKAHQIYKETLKQAEVIGDKHRVAESLYNIGRTYNNLGDNEKTLEYYELSLEIYKETSDKEGTSKVLESIGYLGIELGNYDKSLKSFNEALPIRQNKGDKRKLAGLLDAFGMVYRLRGETDLAEDYFNRSLNIYKEIENKEDYRKSLQRIGGAYLSKGDYKQALEYATLSLELNQEISDHIGSANSLGQIGYIYFAQGENDLALDYFSKALNIFKDIGDKEGMTGILLNMGYLYQNKLDLDTTIDYYNEALTLSNEIDTKHSSAYILSQLGSVYEKKGDFNLALNYSNRALLIIDGIGVQGGSVEVLNDIGIIYYLKGEYKKALGYLEKSIKIKDEIDLGFTYETASLILRLSKKYLGRQYDLGAIHTLIKEAKYIDYSDNYLIYQLLEDASYLETAYNQVQEKAEKLEPDVKAKFLSYPIPKAIVEEWEKVK